MQAPIAALSRRPRRSAKATARSTSSPGATTSSTYPIAAACAGESGAPSSTIRRARAVPSSRARRWVPPPPGGKASRISGWPMRWSPSAISRTSQARASSEPPPIAEPLIAATNTAPQRFMRKSIAWKRSSCTRPAAGVRVSASSTGGRRRSAPTARSDASAARGPTVGAACDAASSSAMS